MLIELSSDTGKKTVLINTGDRSSFKGIQIDEEFVIADKIEASISNGISHSKHVAHSKGCAVPDIDKSLFVSKPMKELKFFSENMSVSQLLVDAVFINELGRMVGDVSIPLIEVKVRPYSVAKSITLNKLIETLHLIVETGVRFYVPSKLLVSTEGKIHVGGRPHLKCILSGETLMVDAACKHQGAQKQ